MNEQGRVDNIIQMQGILAEGTDSRDVVLHKGLFQVAAWAQKLLPQVKPEELIAKDYVLYEHEGTVFEAVRLPLGEDESYWMAQFRHPCREIEGRTWSTEMAFMSNKAEDSVIMGVRQQALNKNRSAPASPVSMPQVAKILIDHPGLRTGYGLALDGRPILLTEYEPDFRQHVEGFLGLLEDKRRDRPVIVVTPKSRENSMDSALLNPYDLAETVNGLAHVFYLDNEANRHVAQIVGREMAVYNAGIRFYMPGFDRHLSSLGDHPLMLADRAAQRYKGPKPLMEVLLKRCFEYSVHDQQANIEKMPRFSHLRTLYFQNQSQQSATKISKPEIEVPHQDTPQAAYDFLAEEWAYLRHREHMKGRVSSLCSGDESSVAAAHDSRGVLDSFNAVVRERDALRVEVSEALDIAATHEAEKRNALKERDSLLARVEDVEAQLQQISKVSVGYPAIGKGLFPPLSLVGEWVDAMIGDRLVLSPRAIKAAKDAEYLDISRVYRSLLLLGNEYLSMRAQEMQKGGLAHRRYHEKLDALGLEETSTIDRSFNIKKIDDQYTTVFDGRKYYLDRHLKHGNSRDPRYCMRIYFTHDEDKERVVVGHLPSHLRNSLT